MDKSENLKRVELGCDEIWPLINILNEICYGIHIKNFEEIFGEEHFVIDLMERIIQEKGKDSIFVFNSFELKIIQNSFEEVFKEIEDWEFQTRIGIFRKEALEILDKIIQT